jgi:hypothetical protein
MQQRGLSQGYCSYNPATFRTGLTFFSGTIALGEAFSHKKNHKK